MKIVKWSVIILIVVLLGTMAAIFIYVQSSRPVYHGERYIDGVEKEVKIYFDNYGIPHIVAENSSDAYFALGYAQAQERLFQMELLRRVGSGRLAEILGDELVEVDAFFRTLGIAESSKEAVSIYFRKPNEEWQINALDFLKGINAFIKSGPTPPEFLLLNIPKEPFTTEDIYNITAYMSFSFAEALRTDPIVDKITRKLGQQYLNSFELTPTEHKAIDTAEYKSKNLTASINRIFNKLPVLPWIGSNAWALSPAKSVTGKVLFANDTHIGYQQPSVWYEAHIEYPGLSLYGNYLPGLPFPLVGHNRNITWGLTMFENDDMNLYRQKSDGKFPGKYYYKNSWRDYKSKKEIIKIKNKPDSVITVRESVHGPVINDVVPQLDSTETNPVALWWTYTRLPPTALQVTYELSHSGEINGARAAASKVNAPGLNIVYGDVAGNIAIWAAARLPVYRSGIVTNVILDGVSGKDDIIKYHPFDQNPQIENPESGYVSSCNNNFNSNDSVLIPGYYAPAYRINKLNQLISSKQKWSLKELEKLNLNTSSEVHQKIASDLFDIIKNSSIISQSKIHRQAAIKLKTWDGRHDVSSITPTIYYKFLSNIFELAMMDELGEEDYNTFVNTHLMKCSYSKFINDNQSLWWDNINSDTLIENKNFIIVQAFIKTIKNLNKDLGSIKNWTWGGIHTVEHIHPIGRKKPFNKIFNVGPFPIRGGIETINNAGFKLSSNSTFDVTYGPAMRIMIDLGDIDHGKSVLPTGQSGHIRSPHYKDQAYLHINGKFRDMMMNQKEIISNCINTLTLRPN